MLPSAVQELESSRNVLCHMNPLNPAILHDNRPRTDEASKESITLTMLHEM